MSKMTTLEDLLVEEMKDIYSAEQQLLKALPKMAKKAHSEKLREAIEQHMEETQEQVERLEKAFELLGKPAKGKKCEAMAGLIEEGQQMLSEDADAAVRDAGIICAAQKVEHYEIASYGCLRTFAELLGKDEVAELFEETLEEEKKTDETLTEIAESEINVEAMAGSEDK